MKLNTYINMRKGFWDLNLTMFCLIPKELPTVPVQSSTQDGGHHE